MVTTVPVPWQMVHSTVPVPLAAIALKRFSHDVNEFEGEQYEPRPDTIGSMAVAVTTDFAELEALWEHEFGGCGSAARPHPLATVPQMRRAMASLIPELTKPLDSAQLQMCTAGIWVADSVLPRALPPVEICSEHPRPASCMRFEPLRA